MKVVIPRVTEELYQVSKLAQHYHLHLLLTNKKNNEEDDVGDQLLQCCLDLSINIVLLSQLLLRLPDRLEETPGTSRPSNKTFLNIFYILVSR